MDAHKTASVTRLETWSPFNKGTRKNILRLLVAESSRFKIRSEDYLEVANLIWSGLDTPRSLACHLLLKYGEYAQLVNLKCDPNHYLYEAPRGSLRGDGADFADDYLATSLLAKWPSFQHADLDPESACIEADGLAETFCRISNRRLRKALAAPDKGNSAYLHLISQMQADIARVLGPFDPARWQEACRFGPGKAAGQEGLCDYEKLIARPSSTSDFLLAGTTLIAECLPWLEAVSNRGADPFSLAWFGDEEDEAYGFDVAIEPGDRNIMVPKNAKTHRGIRPQPGLNVYAQLGLGHMIRDRLKQAGLDLDDQAPNQRLAQLGSGRVPGLVTLDLKGASGHICRELPAILLEDDSPRWYYAMALCRTHQHMPHGCVGFDEWAPLQSFSAMGNGYTFELETLIFWAAVRACRRQIKDTQQYRVYGDDIICSRKTADVLVPFLEFLGFPINAKKTFLEGPFRESCGADFWHGINIRPIHFSTSQEEIKEANESGTSILRWLQVCNAIRRLARRRNHGYGCDTRLLAAWRAAILRIPRQLRRALKGPWDDVRDDSLITDDADAISNPLVTRCGSLQALTGPRLSVRVGKLDPNSFFGAKAALLYRCWREDRVTLRYDRTRSWLRRFLQNLQPEKSLMQVAADRYAGARSSGPTVVFPNLRSIRLGAGWEVFHPVGDVTEWTRFE